MRFIFLKSVFIMASSQNGNPDKKILFCGTPYTIGGLGVLEQNGKIENLLRALWVSSNPPSRGIDRRFEPYYDSADTRYYPFVQPVHAVLSSLKSDLGVLIFRQFHDTSCTDSVVVRRQFRNDIDGKHAVGLLKNFH